MSLSGVAGAVTWSGSAEAAPTAYSIWPASAVPSSPSNPDSSVELGARFHTSATGWVTGIRYYKSAANTGVHTGTLWSWSGTALAKVTFAGESTTGWQQATLPAAVRLAVNTDYVVSYRAPQGGYAADTGTLSTSRPASAYALTATQGTYSYGSAVPKSTWSDANYFVDVAFTTTAPAPAPSATTTPPTPTSTECPPDTTPPSIGGKPGATNTGVPAGVVLQASGPITVTTANAVIDSMDISGPVVIQASNVTIRRSKIRGTGEYYGIYVRSGSVNVVDTEIFGFQNGIAFDNWTATRVSIHGMSDDGVKLGSNVRLQDSWIHDMTPSAGAHADGGQMQGGSTNLTVSHNVIDMVSGAELGNAALFLAPDLGPSSDGPVTIANNWLNGGNYTLYSVDGNNGQYLVKNIAITGNRFGARFNYGPARINVPITQSGNVWDASGIALVL